MNILAFETSHSEASVALQIDDSVYEKRIVSDKRHEETVMPAVAELMQEHSVSVDDLDMVAVDIGPGSFTGIRIGICHANAIADAVRIPCIGICALEAMASGVNAEGNIGVMIDAGNDNCYGAVFDIHRNTVLSPIADSVCHFRELADSLSCIKLIRDLDGITPTAGMIAKIAFSRMEGQNDPELRASPLYLRPSQAERKRNA